MTQGVNVAAAMNHGARGSGSVQVGGTAAALALALLAGGGALDNAKKANGGIVIMDFGKKPGLVVDFRTMKMVDETRIPDGQKL